MKPNTRVTLLSDPGRSGTIVSVHGGEARVKWDAMHRKRVTTSSHALDQLAAVATTENDQRSATVSSKATSSKTGATVSKPESKASNADDFAPGTRKSSRIAASSAKSYLFDKQQQEGEEEEEEEPSPAPKRRRQTKVTDTAESDGGELTKRTRTRSTSEEESPSEEEAEDDNNDTDKPTATTKRARKVSSGTTTTTSRGQKTTHLPSSPRRYPLANEDAVEEGYVAPWHELDAAPKAVVLKEPVIEAGQEHVTKTRAKSEFHLTDDDLAGLEHILRRNPHYRSAAPMQLYKVTDVLPISKIRREEYAAKLTEKKGANKKAWKERMLKLETNLRKKGGDLVLLFNRIPARMKDLLSDFAQPDVLHPKTVKITTANDLVLRAWKIFHLVPPAYREKESIYTGLFDDPALLGMKTRAEAVRWIAGALHRFSLLRQVLSTMHIPLRRLLQNDGPRVAKAFPNETFTETYTKVLDETERKVLAKLAVRFGKRDGDEVNRMIDECNASPRGAFAALVERASESPSHRYLGINAVVEEITFLLENPGTAERLRKLQVALAKHEVPLRSDSMLAQEWSRGRCGRVLEEVICYLRITRALFDNGGHRAWSENVSHFEGELDRRVRRDEISWDEATTAILGKDWGVLYSDGDYSSDDYSDDYSDEGFYYDGERRHNRYRYNRHGRYFRDGMWW